MAGDSNQKPIPATATIDLNEYQTRLGGLIVENEKLKNTIEQLRSDNKKLHRDSTRFNEIASREQARAERYKKVLEWYADDDNYQSVPVQKDGRFYWAIELGSKLARKVLGRE